MTYAVHTSNRGWLCEPNPFRHLPAVVVERDDSLADDTFRLYAGAVPIDKVRPITPHVCIEIRRAIAKHQEERPAVEEVAPMVEADEAGQMRLLV